MLLKLNKFATKPEYDEQQFMLTHYPRLEITSGIVFKDYFFKLQFQLFRVVCEVRMQKGNCLAYPEHLSI
jgi:hypothetical protein